MCPCASRVGLWRDSNARRFEKRALTSVSLFRRAKSGLELHACARERHGSTEKTGRKHARCQRHAVLSTATPARARMRTRRRRRLASSSSSRVVVVASRRRLRPSGPHGSRGGSDGCHPRRLHGHGPVRPAPALRVAGHEHQSGEGGPPAESLVFRVEALPDLRGTVTNPGYLMIKRILRKGRGCSARKQTAKTVLCKGEC